MFNFVFGYLIWPKLTITINLSGSIKIDGNQILQKNYVLQISLSDLDYFIRKNLITLDTKINNSIFYLSSVILLGSHQW